MTTADSTTPSFHKGQKVSFRVASKTGLADPVVGVYDRGDARGRVVVVRDGREFKPFAKHVAATH